MACSEINNLPEVFRHNYNTLLEASSEQKLDEHEGRLTIANQPQSYESSSNSRFNRVANTVDKTCQALFNRITAAHLPLSSNSLALSKERRSCQKLLDHIERIGQRLITEKTKEKLQVLIDSPEALEASLALQKGIEPIVLNQTSSGTYVLRNRLSKDWGIFKPKVQELGGPKNPSWDNWAAGVSSRLFGIAPETSYLRERAAYLLDRDRFANVPLTTIATFVHRKLDTSWLPSFFPPQLIGSFQSFKQNCQPACKVIPPNEYLNPKYIQMYGPPPIKAITTNKDLNPPSLWDKLVVLVNKLKQFVLDIFNWLFGKVNRPIERIEKKNSIGRIHPLAIFDIRVLNCDRHLGNLLIGKDGTAYPIDHGFILPSQANRLRLEWKNLEQSQTPFNQEELQYIRQLDAEEDAKTLRKCGITDQSVIERMKLATRLLKVCAAKNFTPYHIADLMTTQVGEEVFFEKNICEPILTSGRNATAVIEKVAQDYFNRHRA